jgi:hypothetical protein
LKESQAEIMARIEQHQQGDGEYRTTLESLISLASRAAELFERSKIEQKRQLLSRVFSNLRLRGKKLEFSLRSPFDLMGQSGKLFKLAGGLGFEPRFSESESDVLPLNYPPPRRGRGTGFCAPETQTDMSGGAESRAERGRYMWFCCHGPPLRAPAPPAGPTSRRHPLEVVGSREERDPTYGLISFFARSTVAFGVA